MSGPAISKKEAKWQAMANGVSTVLPATSSLLVNGVTMTQAQILAQLNATLSLFTASDSAKSAASAAVAAVQSALPAGTVFEENLVTALKAYFGKDSPQLQKFGITLPKAKAPKTAGQKAVANAKREATRKARGIMGAKQRAAIQPNAVPVTVTLGPDGKPVAPAASAPATSAPAAAPPAAAPAPAK